MTPKHIVRSGPRCPGCAYHVAHDESYRPLVQRPVRCEPLWYTSDVPQTPAGIVGQREAVEQLIDWLTKFAMGQKDIPVAALISGPPGCGKRMLACACLRVMGYVPMEYTAEQARGRDFVVSTMVPLRHVEHSAIVLRHLEAMEKTGLESFVELLLRRRPAIENAFCGSRKRGRPSKRNPQVEVTPEEFERLSHERSSLETPIICTCESPFGRRVKTLRPYCQCIAIPRLSTEDLETLLHRVLRRHSLHLWGDTKIHQLAVISHGDARVLLNMAQFCARVWKKPVDTMRFCSMYDIPGEVLEVSRDILRHPDISLEEMEKRVSACEFETLLRLLMENYANFALPGDRPMVPDDFVRLAEAAETCAKGDVLNVYIFGRRLFELNPVYFFFAVYKLVHTSQWTPQTPPEEVTLPFAPWLARWTRFRKNQGRILNMFTDPLHAPGLRYTIHPPTFWRLMISMRERLSRFESDPQQTAQWYHDTGLPESCIKWIAGFAELLPGPRPFPPPIIPNDFPTDDIEDEDDYEDTESDMYDPPQPCTISLGRGAKSLRTMLAQLGGEDEAHVPEDGERKGGKKRKTS